MDKNKIAISLRKWRGLLIIVMAALLLELLSAAQYYLTHRILDDELEKRAESELTLKAILIKSNLNSIEALLEHSMWKIQAHLDQPDSAYITMRRLVTMSEHLQGAGLGFEPYYYPQKGHFYEVYARRLSNGEVETSQIGGSEHDYTQLDFYKRVVQTGKGLWTEPYMDDAGAKALITTYFQPVRDRKGGVVAVAGVDMSLEWLTDTVDNRHIYPSSFIMVLTEDDVPVLQPFTDRISSDVQQYVYRLITDSTTVARKKSKSGRSTVLHFDTDKRDGTIYYAFMKGQPHWKIAVVCYDDEVFASLRQLRLWMLELMLLAFCILLYVVWRFARGEKKMVSTNRLLAEKTLEEERMNGELRIASGIQQALLPSGASALKDAGEAQVEGRLIPAKAVGGDLYNMFVRDDKLFFCIGDVSGKGVPAALIMAVTQTLFHNVTSSESNPALIMNRLNATACRNNESNMFATLFVGVLDLPTGRLRYCNAGHEVSMLLSEKLRVNSEELSVKPNLPIGLFSDFNYEMQETVMPPGAILFLYTDGLTEARRGYSNNATSQREGQAGSKLFGRKRVREMLEGCGDMSPKQLVDKVIAEVARFSEHTEQSDDLTLLAIKYTPMVEKIVFNEELTLPNDVKEVEKLGVFIKDVTSRLNIGKPLAPKLRLALEEAVVNVMEYAYPAGSMGEVNIRALSDGQRLRLIITDNGIAFNPTQAATADTTLSAEERPVGGLGILLIRQLMDSINYERIDGKNVLTLTKTLNTEINKT